jgi:hypothetical protein
VQFRHPIRERRARRIVEASLAAAVALLVLVTGLIHVGDHAGPANAAAPSSTTSTTVRHAAHPARAAHKRALTPAARRAAARAAARRAQLARRARIAFDSSPVHPKTIQDEQAFRSLWGRHARFRLAAAYAGATAAERRALDNYFHPKPPAPPAPAPKPVVVAPAPFVSTPVAAVAGWTVWDTIAQCESSGNWADNTGNGYSGGLQFSPSTWLQYGGGQFAPMAWEASRDQQIVVAERIYAAQGSYRAWPVCGARV